jgi:diketogulonate reductase-like aldo/keto reductase
MSAPVDSASVSLPGGQAVPALGLGTWRMGEQPGKRQAELAALQLALELGYRLFDTAEMYAEGGAETLLGEALGHAMRGGLTREQLFVVTKVYPHNAGAKRIVEACERSLRRLQLDHLDLYLLHWRGAVPLRETVEGFEQLQRRGWIRRWGVSNFDLADMHELLDLPGGDACSANQVWYSLQRRGVEFDLLPWQQARGVPLMAYSPIDQGALPRHAGLARLAGELGVDSAQLALAALLARPGVMVIPKSSNADRLRSNLAAAGLQLGEAELARLDRLFPPPRRRQPLAVG